MEDNITKDTRSLFRVKKEMDDTTIKDVRNQRCKKSFKIEKRNR